MFYYFGALGYCYIVGVLIFLPNVRGPFRQRDAPDESTAELVGQLLVLLKSKAMWAIIIANAAHNYGWFVTLSWLPQYFRDLGVELSAVGLYAVAPYIAMVAFENSWATLMDAQLESHRLSLIDVRQLSQCVGFLCPATVVAIMVFAGVGTPWVASAMLSLALGSNVAGSHSGYWANMIDIAPAHAGLTCGLSNTIATLPGAYGNSLTGFVLSTTQSWPAVFSVAILHWLVGAVVFWRWSSADKVV